MSTESTITLTIIISILILLGFILFIVNIVSLHQKNRDKFLLEMEKLKNSFKHEILQSELEMQEHTFETISMEIHDNVSQLLSVSKLTLNMIDEAPAETLERIRYSVDLVDQAMRGLRDLSQRLASDMIRQEGLYRAIEDYIGWLSKSIPGKIIFTADGYSAALAVDKELILFRMLQEAVNNVFKHAKASLIEIGMVFTDEQMRLSISDNGIGFNPLEVSGRLHGGAGIKNMQKRSAMIGSQFSLHSEAGKGTRIIIELPLGEES
jgi:signal transduction histidine kinase